MTTIHQGDNTQAFGNNFIRVHFVAKDKEGNIKPLPKITKAEFRIGPIIKTYPNPTSPLDINYTEEESKYFCANNKGYICVYDEYGHKYTPDGFIEFPADPRRV